MRLRLTSAVSSARAMVIASAMGIQESGLPKGAVQPRGPKRGGSRRPIRFVARVRCNLLGLITSAGHTTTCIPGYCSQRGRSTSSSRPTRATDSTDRGSNRCMSCAEKDVRLLGAAAHVPQTKLGPDAVEQLRRAPVYRWLLGGDRRDVYGTEVHGGAHANRQA